MLSCHLCYAFIISQPSSNHDIKLVTKFLLAFDSDVSKILSETISEIFLHRFLYLAPSPLSPNAPAASAPTDAVQTVQRALT